jgi:hypothetical protein
MRVDDIWMSLWIRRDGGVEARVALDIGHRAKQLEERASYDDHEEECEGGEDGDGTDETKTAPVAIVLNFFEELEFVRAVNNCKGTSGLTLATQNTCTTTVRIMAKPTMKLCVSTIGRLLGPAGNASGS